MLGLPGGPATIVADDNSAGHAIIPGPGAIQDNWDLRQKYRLEELVLHGRIMAFMAGAEAERHLLGVCQGGDGDDKKQIWLMAERLDVAKASGISHPDVHHFVDRLRARTAGLVRRHREPIARVSEALFMPKDPVCG